MQAPAHDHAHRGNGFGGTDLPTPSLLLPINRRDRATFVVPIMPTARTRDNEIIINNRATQHTRHLRNNNLVTVPRGAYSSSLGAVAEGTTLLGGIVCSNRTKVRRRRIGGTSGVGPGLRGQVLNMNMATDEAELACNSGVEQTVAALIAKGMCYRFHASFRAVHGCGVLFGLMWHAFGVVSRYHLFNKLLVVQLV